MNRMNLLMSRPNKTQIKKMLTGMRDKKPVKLILKKNMLSEDGEYPLLLSDHQMKQMNIKHGQGMGYGITFGKRALMDMMNMSRTMGQSGSGWIKDIYTFFKPSLKELGKNALTAYVGPASGPIVEQSTNIIDKGVDWLDKKLSPRKKLTKAELDAMMKPIKEEQARVAKHASEVVAKQNAKKAAAKSAAAQRAQITAQAQKEADDEEMKSKKDLEQSQSVFIPEGGMLGYEECECPHCEGSGFILNAITRAVQKNLMPRRPPPRRMMGGPRRGGELSAPGREAGPTQLY